MNSVTIQSFTKERLVELFGQYQADLFLLMWKTRLFNHMQWEEGSFTFFHPKDSRSPNTIEVDAQNSHDGLYNFLVEVIKYNLRNKK